VYLNNNVRRGANAQASEGDESARTSQRRRYTLDSLQGNDPVAEHGDDEWKRVCALIKSLVGGITAALASDQAGPSELPDKFDILYGLEGYILSSLCRHHVPRRPEQWAFPPLMTINVNQVRAVMFPYPGDSGGNNASLPLVVQVRGNHFTDIGDVDVDEREKNVRILPLRSSGSSPRDGVPADLRKPPDQMSGRRDHLIVQSVSSDDIDEQWIDMHQVDINHKKRMAKLTQSKQREEQTRGAGVLSSLLNMVGKVLVGQSRWRLLAGRAHHSKELEAEAAVNQSVFTKKSSYAYSHQNIAWTRKKWYIHIGVDFSIFFASTEGGFIPSRAYRPQYSDTSTVLRLKLVNLELNFVNSMLPSATIAREGDRLQRQTSKDYKKKDTQHQYRTTSEMRLRITSTAIRVTHVTNRIIQGMSSMIVGILQDILSITSDVPSGADNEDAVVNEVIFFMSCEVPYIRISIQDDTSDDGKVKELCQLVLRNLSLGIAVNGAQQHIQMRLHDLGLEDTREQILKSKNPKYARKSFLIAPLPLSDESPILINRPILRWWWALDVLLWRKCGRKAGFNIFSRASERRYKRGKRNANTYLETWLRPLRLSLTKNYLQEPLLNLDVTVDNNDVHVVCCHRWINLYIDVGVVERMTMYVNRLMQTVSSSIDEKKQDSGPAVVLGDSSADGPSDRVVDMNKAVKYSVSYGDLIKSKVDVELDVAYVRILLAADAVEFSSVHLKDIDMYLAVEGQVTSKSATHLAPYVDGNRALYREVSTTSVSSKSALTMDLAIGDLSVYDWVVSKLSVAEGFKFDDGWRPRRILSQREDSNDLQLTVKVLDESLVHEVYDCESVSTSLSQQTKRNRSEVVVEISVSEIDILLLLRWIDDLVYVVDRIMGSFAVFSDSAVPAPEISQVGESVLEVAINIDKINVVFPRHSQSEAEAIVIDIGRFEMLMLDEDRFSIDIRDICCFTRIVEKHNFRPVTYQLLEPTHVGIVISSKNVSIEQSTSKLQTVVSLSIDTLHCHFGHAQFNIIMSLVYEHLNEELNFGVKEIKGVSDTVPRDDDAAGNDEVAFANFAFGVSSEGLYRATVIELRVGNIEVDIEASEPILRKSQSQEG